MSNISLYEIIVLAAKEGLKLQSSNGAMPGGHNGPYRDKETPVRNTGHWLIIYKKAYEFSGNEQFKTAAFNCLQYLLAEEARPKNATFWHRTKPGKDSTNGIIGQAWTIEALIEAYDLFQDEKLLALSKEVFSLHPYDESVQGWKVVNVDGSIRGFDHTFNHQLWFAAIGARLMKSLNEDDINGVRHFINNIEHNIQLYNDGVIRHLPIFYLKKGLVTRSRAIVSFFKQVIKQKKYIYSKSVGYHGFNLYALGLIDKYLPTSKVLESHKINKAIRVVSKEKFKANLNDSKYGYPYNPAGIELAYTFDVLSDQKSRDFWISEQIKKTFDFSSNLMTLGKTFDTNTAAARLYEAVQINNTEIQL